MAHYPAGRAGFGGDLGERRGEDEAGIVDGAAERVLQLLQRDAWTKDFRQADALFHAVLGERFGQSHEQIAVRIAGLEDHAPPHARAIGDAAREEIGKEARAHQRGLARTGCAEHQQEGLAFIGVLDDLLDGLQLRRAAPEEDRRVFKLVGRQAAEGRLHPGRAHIAAGLDPALLDSGADQLAQMRLEHVAEVFEVVETVIGREEDAARLEIARPEILQRRPLVLGELLLLRIAQRDLRLAIGAVDEEVRRALVAIGGECVFVFPLRAGHRRPAIEAAIFALARIDRQRRAEARPEDQHHDIGLAGRLDHVLEMPGREHRLVFPEIGRDVEEARKFLFQALYHQRRAPALGRHIARRGDENAQWLRHGEPLGQRIGTTAGPSALRRFGAAR